MVGEYAPFSSYGTMMNGVAQPVVSAPGVNIVSSWNKYFIPSCDTVLDNMQWMGSPYGSESGTSMSCPMVSGIIALWLEANPELTIEDLKDVMRETCVNDESTAKSLIRWGYGKIKAAKGIEYINSHNSIRGVQDFEVAKTGIIYDLSGRRVTNPSHGIYIKDGQKFVVK